MPVNLDKPHLWKADVARSVDMYNDWFMRFAPHAFRSTRLQTTKDVEAALRATGNLTNVQPALLRAYPEILPTLRMSTCPPLAVDRLIGLAGVSPNVVKCMEMEGRLPVRMAAIDADRELLKIATIIGQLVWCLRSKHQIIETAARATDAKMVSALLCHTKGLGS